MLALTFLHLSSCSFSCYLPFLTPHVFVRILKNLFSQCSVLGFLLCSLYNSPELSSVQSRLYLVSRNSRPLYLCLLPITWQFPDLQPPAPVIMEHNIKKFLSWHLIRHVLFTFNLLVYTSFHLESHYLLLQYNAQEKAHIKLDSLKCNMRTCDKGTCICHA